MNHIKQLLKITEDPDGGLSCHHLDLIYQSVKSLRHNILISYEEAGTDPVAEAHLLSGLAELEKTAQTIKLASLAQRRAKAFLR